jgi:hypothetical protein
VSSLAEAFFEEAMACSYLHCEHKSAPSFQDIEKQIRKEIAEEIECYRVNRCRCEQSLEKDCDALLNAIQIVEGGTND